MIFRIVCQISGQDNVRANPKIILAKGCFRNICFNAGFVCNRNLTIAMRCKAKIQQTLSKLKRELSRVVKF